MDWEKHITIDPKIQHGRPVIRGTRMPVEYVLGSLAGGMSFADIQRAYEITEDGIQAAILFAKDLIEQGQFHPLPTQKKFFA